MWRGQVRNGLHVGHHSANMHRYDIVLVSIGRLTYIIIVSSIIIIIIIIITIITIYFS